MGRLGRLGHPGCPGCPSCLGRLGLLGCLGCLGRLGGPELRCRAVLEGRVVLELVGVMVLTSNGLLINFKHGQWKCETRNVR